MDQMENAAKSCHVGEYKAANKPLMCNFNSYFLEHNFDAFAVDDETSGNLLYFTLMFSYFKYGWANHKIDLERFRNLAFRMQTSYR